MKAANVPLYGLDNEPVPVQGIIRLEVTMGTHPRSITRELAFLVIDLPSVYNAIFGRPFLTAFEAVTSIPHLKVKFPTSWGVGEVLGDQEMGRTSYLSQVNPVAPSGDRAKTGPPRRDAPPDSRAKEETEAMPLNPSDPGRCVNVGRSLPLVDRDELITFLRANSDVFAWVPADMPGISAEVIVHKLDLDASRKPVRQKRRNHSVEKLVTIREEVKRLLDAGFIRESVNKAAPKIAFRFQGSTGSWIPHPARIAELYGRLLGIQPDPDGPRRRGAHLVHDRSRDVLLQNDALWSPRMQRHVPAPCKQNVRSSDRTECGGVRRRYACKKQSRSHHVNDLDETFQILRQHGMKLNPVKCAFGVTSGKFLGFIVSQRGIEANPEKIKAILDLNPPRTIKEVQKLTGRIAALSRFLAKSADKYLPFFKALRGTKSHGFKWNEECDEAFKELKTYLSSTPLLSSPRGGEDLYLYLATSASALGSVLVAEHEGKQQPVYYVSRALADFIVEAATPAQDEDSNPGDTEHDSSPVWTLNVDGSSTQAGSGVGIVLRTPEGVEIVYSVTLAFPATNNVAEYEALIAGLRLARECSARSLVIRSGSELVVNQVKGNFEASNPQLVKYLAKVRALIPEFGRFEIEHISRTDNERLTDRRRGAVIRARRKGTPGSPERAQH
ncbi:hypothetical protein Nepgr_031452 [Nepenthes gracilis]|uniref:RNase H type-1 domain-containing protein n=1 Tax=Nepenthes gracilis TaxID=150966 RepID=A0AAD3Y735_NEPGR|nr:hypothetical protein Nepgr_031452 [Nepenthes gracilis]